MERWVSSSRGLWSENLCAEAFVRPGRGRLPRYSCCFAYKLMLSMLRTCSTSLTAGPPVRGCPSCLAGGDCEAPAPAALAVPATASCVPLSMGRRADRRHPSRQAGGGDTKASAPPAAPAGAVAAPPAQAFRVARMSWKEGRSSTSHRVQRSTRVCGAAGGAAHRAGTGMPCNERCSLAALQFCTPIPIQVQGRGSGPQRVPPTHRQRLQDSPPLRGRVLRHGGARQPHGLRVQKPLGRGRGRRGREGGCWLVPLPMAAATGTGTRRQACAANHSLRTPSSTAAQPPLLHGCTRGIHLRLYLRVQHRRSPLCSAAALAEGVAPTCV